MWSEQFDHPSQRRWYRQFRLVLGPGGDSEGSHTLVCSCFEVYGAAQPAQRLEGPVIPLPTPTLLQRAVVPQTSVPASAPAPLSPTVEETIETHRHSHPTPTSTETNLVPPEPPSHEPYGPFQAPKRYSAWQPPGKGSSFPRWQVRNDSMPPPQWKAPPSPVSSNEPSEKVPNPVQPLRKEAAAWIPSSMVSTATIMEPTGNPPQASPPTPPTPVSHRLLNPNAAPFCPASLPKPG